MADDRVPLPRPDPRAGPTRYRQIQGEMEKRTAEAQRNREANRDLVRTANPPIPVTSGPALGPVLQPGYTDAQRIFDAHAAFHPADMGRAVPQWPTDDDVLNTVGGRALLLFPRVANPKGPYPGIETAQLPPDPKLMLPSEESERSMSIGKVLRKKDED